MLLQETDLADLESWGFRGGKKVSHVFFYNTSSFITHSPVNWDSGSLAWTEWLAQDNKIRKWQKQGWSPSLQSLDQLFLHLQHLPAFVLAPLGYPRCIFLVDLGKPSISDFPEPSIVAVNYTQGSLPIQMQHNLQWGQSSIIGNAWAWTKNKCILN